MEKTNVNTFLSAYMGKIGYKHAEADGVSKFYNKDFDVIIYKNKKTNQALIIDKRISSTHPIIYNDLHIALKTLDAS